MFSAHPKTKDLFPKFANIPTASLSTNPEFVAIGNMMVSGIEFMAKLVDQPDTLRQMLGNKSYGQYFVQDVPISAQLEVNSLVNSFIELIID